MINGRSKGAGGERELCRWLQETLNLQTTPERNLDQVRNGGSDINEVAPFMFEVKRCEALAKRAWWVQVKKASNTVPGTIPVVAYRQNRKPWRFLISAEYIGLDLGFIQLEEFEFVNWIKNYYGMHNL